MKSPGIVARFFQKILILTRPLQHAILGPADCLYPVSCTDYALGQLQEAPLHTAIWHIFKRVISCNPLTSLFYQVRKCLSIHINQQKTKAS